MEGHRQTETQRIGEGRGNRKVGCAPKEAAITWQHFSYREWFAKLDGYKKVASLRWSKESGVWECWARSVSGHGRIKCIGCKKTIKGAQGLINRHVQRAVERQAKVRAGWL